MQKRIAQVVLLMGLLGVFVFGYQQARAQEPEAQDLSTGMVKPLSGLRDYNGTYEGAVGTGSISYSRGTLYRDNQNDGATAGCRGEGCGKHPGVDIPVPTGTTVYSVTWSQVVISRCDPSWGGLIVLKGRNPYTTEIIYVVYGHLSQRAYSNGAPVEVGHYVSAGVQIGKTGGGSTSPCSGNSTGPHLHFQIDRDDGNPEPYYPAASQLNYRDDSFQVMARTYNPIAFITGGYKWEFNLSGTTSASRELWDLFNFQSWGVSNGALFVDAGNDPYIRRGGLTNCGLSKPCSSNIAAEANQYRQVYLDVYNGCNTGIGTVYFTTNNSPNWSEDKSWSYQAVAGSQRVYVWMAGNYYWNGIITGLRVDPAQNCNPNGYDPTFYKEITLIH